MKSYDFSEAKNGLYFSGMKGGNNLRGWDTGRIIPDDVKTTADAMKAAGLNWSVTQRPVYAHTETLDDQGNEIMSDEPHESEATRAPRHIANVRTDTGEILGIVGRNWRGPQNWEAFNFMDDLVDDGSAKWLGAGEMDGGRRIFGVAKFNRDILIGGDEDERCLPLAFLSNGWDGSLSVTVAVAPFRLACTNGMTLPIKGAMRQWKVQHRSNFAMNLADARRTLELSIGYLDTFEEMANAMLVTKVSDQSFAQFVERLVPMPAFDPADMDKGGRRVVTNVHEMRELITNTYRTADDLQNIRGTAWGAYNAVADYADWQAPQRGERREEKRLIRSINDSTLKNRAFELLADEYVLATA